MNVEVRSTGSTRWSKRAISIMIGYPPPSKLEMNDLSDLFDGNMLNITLDTIIPSATFGPTKFPGIALWRNLVRLTDQSLREYGLARKELGLWIGSGHNSMDRYFRAVDSLEQSVVAAHRAILMAKGLKKKRLGRGSALPTRNRIRLVREMRDIIIHTDDRLAGMTSTRGGRVIVPLSAQEAAMLRPLDDRVELGAHQLKYADLAACIKNLYTIIETVRGAPSK